MSETFKAICKKDVIFKYNNMLKFLKGNEYSYRLTTNSRFIRKVVDDGTNHRCEFSEQDFNEHFYSIKELRKEKLENLKNV